MRSDIQLAVLRAKTDQDLANLFQRRIGLGLEAVRRGELAQAEAEYTEASNLLRVARGLPDAAFQALGSQLTELRTDLENCRETCALLAS
jgi:hypothetical protein